MDSTNPEERRKPSKIFIDPLDPRNVERLVDELKAQGVLDDIRRECLSEVDTKPAYHNLQQRVKTSIDKFLDKQHALWKPTTNKTQLRNSLRRYIQDMDIDRHVDTIVNQTVNPKVSIIEPLVESIVYKVLGVEEADLQAEDFHNGNGSPDKMSTISSEDIDMATGEHRASDAEERQNYSDAASSPGAGIRGNISPLTPDRGTGARSNLTNQSKNADSESDVDMRAKLQASPLTPPLPPVVQPEIGVGEYPVPPLPPPTGEQSPRTPPYPPPPQRALYEEVVAATSSMEDDDNMSPVSDADFENISPPKDSPETPDECSLPSPPPEHAAGHPTPPSYIMSPPPPPPPLPAEDVCSPPPPPQLHRIKQVAASPITSPIESSSDEMEAPRKGASSSAAARSVSASSVSASDISDTDFAIQSEGEKGSSEEIDLEELERAREKLRAKLALEGSDEGEVQTEEEVDEEKAASAIEAEDVKIEKPEEEELMSPVSEEEEDDQTGTASDLHLKRDEDDNDGSAGASGGSGAGDTGSGPSTSTAGHGGSGHRRDDDRRRDDQRRDSSDRERHSGHRSDKDRSKDRHSSSHNHRHHSRDDKEHRRHSSGGKSSSRDDKKSRDEIRRNDDSKKSTAYKKEKEERDRLRREKVEEDVKKSYILKSDKFKDVDMFAPKAAKPKLSLITAASPRFERSMSSSMTSPVSSGGKSTPVVFSAKTSGPATPQPSTTTSSKSTTKSVDTTSAKASKPTDRPEKSISNTPKKKPVDANDFYREMALSAAASTSPVFAERRVLPELPVSKCDGDKHKQHTDDFNDTKRRLDEAKQRRIAEQKRQQDEKKKRKLSASGSVTPKENFEPAEKIKRLEKATRSPKINQDKTETNSSKRRRIPSSGNESSDGEWRRDEKSSTNGKKRRKSSSKRRFDLSSSGEEEEEVTKEEAVMTRKLTTKETLLNIDTSIGLCNGLEAPPQPSTVKEPSFDVDLSDEGEVDITFPPFNNAKTENSTPIYLTGFDFPEKMIMTLKKVSAGGKVPKLVQPFPDWLSTKLSTWSLQRHDVDVIYPHEIDKIRKKRNIIPERDYDALQGISGCDSLGSTSAAAAALVDEEAKKIEDILMEEMPDIVTSNTPEPTAVSAPVVKEEIAPEVKEDPIEEESGNTLSSEVVVADGDVDGGLIGFTKAEEPPRLSISYGINDEDLTDPIDLPAVYIGINPEASKVFRGALKNNKDKLSILQQIQVQSSAAKIVEAVADVPVPREDVEVPEARAEPPAVVNNVPQVLDKTENSTPSNANFGGLCEVDDEFLADVQLDADEIITPPSTTKKTRAPRKPREQQSPPQTKAPRGRKPGSGRGRGRGGRHSAATTTSGGQQQLEYPLPPSPMSSPSEEQTLVS